MSYCPNCGKELKVNSNFCSSCGNPVKQNTVTIDNEKNMYSSKPETNDVQNPWGIPQHSSPQNIQLKNDLDKHSISNNNKKKHTGGIIALVSALGSIIVIAAIVILATIVIPNVRYNKAHDLYSNGSYYDAAIIFDELGDYKDSEQLSADCYFEAGEYKLASDRFWYIKSDNQNNAYKYALCFFKSGEYEDAISAFRDVIDYSDANEMIVKSQVLLIANSNLNDVVTLGCYEQDGKSNNGKEELQWDVVAKENGRVLLWSDKIIEYQKFNDITKETNGISSTDNYISWKNSFVRSWLNGEFFKSAFSEFEKHYIIQTEHITTDCDELTYKTNDNVFLFSSEEFYDLEEMTVGTMNQIETEYAKNKRKDLDGCCNSCYTRDQDEYNGLFGLSDIYCPGVIDNHNTVYFMHSSSEYGAIRPCIWVNISDVDSE